MATRLQIEKMLRDLDTEVPAMQRRLTDPGEFMEQFLVRAHIIRGEVSRDDETWALGQLDGILLKYQAPL